MTIRCAARRAAVPDWERLAQSVVQLIAPDCEQAGSGTIIGDGRLVLTNSHVLHAGGDGLVCEVYAGFTRRFGEGGTLGAVIPGREVLRFLAEHGLQADTDAATSALAILPTVTFPDAAVVAESSESDIDHLVPLAEAWESGGHEWTADTWTRCRRPAQNPCRDHSALRSRARARRRGVSLQAGRTGISRR